jgi:hypothetical protein
MKHGQALGLLNSCRGIMEWFDSKQRDMHVVVPPIDQCKQLLKLKFLMDWLPIFSRQHSFILDKFHRLSLSKNIYCALNYYAINLAPLISLVDIIFNDNLFAYTLMNKFEEIDTLGV